MIDACSICGKPIDARGLCRSHYMRWYRYGDPLGGRGDEVKRCLQTVLAYSGDRCFLWPHAKSGDGYGQIRINRKTTYVHRIVCESVHGPAPTPQHQAAHYCGRGHEGCVTPRHLRWATSSENHSDRFIHKTNRRTKQIRMF